MNDDSHIRVFEAYYTQIIYEQIIIWNTYIHHIFRENMTNTLDWDSVTSTLMLFGDIRKMSSLRLSVW